jgi:hypothetical protein
MGRMNCPINETNQPAKGLSTGRRPLVCSANSACDRITGLTDRLTILEQGLRLRLLGYVAVYDHERKNRGFALSSSSSSSSSSSAALQPGVGFRRLYKVIPPFFALY